MIIEAELLRIIEQLSKFVIIMSILKEIYEYKIDFVSNQKITPQSKIESKLNINNNNFPFFEKLNHQKSQISIIGEIKNEVPL